MNVPHKCCASMGFASDKTVNGNNQGDPLKS